MKHKHCNVIKAWADGAMIQERYSGESVWKHSRAPCWNLDLEYRASLAFVEGKPVFEGDVIYFEGTCVNSNFVAYRATEKCLVDINGASWSIDRCHLEPQKPKTIMVELLRSDVEYAIKYSWHSESSDRIFKAIAVAIK